MFSLKRFQRTTSCQSIVAYSIASLALVYFTNRIVGQEKFEFKARVVDSSSKKMIHSRIYLENSDGNFLHVTSANEKGEVIPYKVIRGPKSQEVHTTVSDHEFKAELPKGKYRLTAEHGKEYLPETIEFEIVDRAVDKTIALRRWSNLAARNWYSGEVHIHRKVAEMPTVMQAEDLNVTLPLTYWVTDSESSPKLHNKSTDSVHEAKLIKVTDKHVIWPVNTEYEIFTVRNKRHTLGAFFILGHRRPLELKTPPVAPIVREAREQNALIDLDKHNWPWSMMLIPKMKVDLFELTNNHIWRTSFLFKDWYKEYAAGYMKLEMDPAGFTPRGWLEFGLHNYYALLNCGFKIRPSGGTASGVHPVPAGFGRVYVHLPEGFSYEAWMKGLKEGRSFVTNGPMLDVKVNGKFPGETFDVEKTQKYSISMKASYPTVGKTDFQVVLNGEVVEPKTVRSGKDHNGVMVLTAEMDLEIKETSWLCVRCLQKQKNENISFAHSAPFFFNHKSDPVKPRKEEVEYLIKRVADEIERHRGTLNPAQIEEFEEALEFYRQKLKIAR